MPAPPRITDNELVEALRGHGGRARLRELVPELGVHRATLHRHFARLVSEGLVEPAGRGEYQLVRDDLGLSQDTALLAEALDRSGLAAHLTGFDLLVPYAHQFVFAVPHLVYAEPMALDNVELELARNGWLVQGIGDGGRRRLSAPDPSKLVLLRKQADPERYRVHGPIAPVEKAWVDALRESSRGTLPVQHMELGRILRGLVDGGADVRFLRHYARQLGYLDRVDAAMQGLGVEDRSDLAALHAGFQA
jgi:hypothetical protein